MGGDALNNNPILFLDIDGVVLPGRAYTLPNQTFDPFVTIFDPCSVSLLNEACKSAGFKIVLHSSWIRTKFIDILPRGDVVAHCINQGIKAEYFHPTDPYCNRDISYRYDRIKEWLNRHPEAEDNFVILDDESTPEGDPLERYLIQTNFDEGITLEIRRKLYYFE